MSSMPRELWTAGQVRELDRRAIELHGVSGRELMERAGAFAFHALLHRWPASRALTVVCGAGNNAGDGYVVARLARRAGLTVRLLSVTDPSGLTGDAAAASADFRREGGEILRWDGTGDPGGDGPLVDALLGTGLSREVTGAFSSAIESINATRRPVLALDLPSGLHADTGRVMGTAIRAHVTACFIGLKLGLFTAHGPEQAGEVLFSSLDVPAGLARGMVPAARRLEAAALSDWLPRRPRDAHKGHFGHVLVVGGDRGMGGAARLAGEAALRVGAGLVTVATREDHVAAMVAARPELMGRSVADRAGLEPLLERATVVAAGPGLGRSAWGRDLLDGVLASGLPCVLDADALNLVAEAPRRLGDSVVTPHPGEAGRLLGSDAAAVEADRAAAVRALRERYGAVVVLKGAGTLVCGAGETLWLCDRGNPGMASGGMGDVLTGIIAGLAAQLRDLERSASAGVLLHALAADDAARAGERGLLAGDLLGGLRAWVNPADAHQAR
ncbi:NAD(P)H-hydrate dehydratase [Wenzhouxiangella sp. XN24]|nr:NAD(P)H-hydrate dehydratase [Wenzhouxiangella sp. XN24]NGX15503.1 NAD(P)H-hydrate dehydratase [Wenzhouxiangella sp. XN24]